MLAHGGKINLSNLPFLSKVLQGIFKNIEIRYIWYEENTFSTNMTQSSEKMDTVNYKLKEYFCSILNIFTMFFFTLSEANKNGVKLDF